MTTSIKYVPGAQGQGTRGSPILNQRQQYSPPNGPAFGSPVFAHSSRHQPDIDQQMRMFMVEKRGTATPQMNPQMNRQAPFSKARQRVISPPGGRGAHAIASSSTFIAGGASPRVVTRTELWPVQRVGGSPTPPSGSPNASPQSRTPQMLPNNTIPEPWQQTPDQPQFRSSSRGSSYSQRRLSLEITQPAARSRSNTLERGSPSAEPRAESMASSMSPPPTPPAKDEYWGSESPNTRPYKDSVILPPPRGASIMPSRSGSLKRENNRNLRIEVAPPPQLPLDTPQPSNGYDEGKTDLEGQKAQGKKKKKQNEKNIMQGVQGVLGIYPAKNKLPPGKSTADFMASKIAQGSSFFQKDKGNSEAPPLSSRSDPTPLSGNERKLNAPNTSSYSPPTQTMPYHPTAGSSVVELPGDIPSAPIPIERRRSPRPKPNGERNRSKPRKKGTKLPVPEAVDTQKYERMPLPAVPPGATTSRPPPTQSSTAQKRLSILIPESNGNGSGDAKARFRMTGHFSPDSGTETEIVDWFETLYIPEEGERKSQANPKMNIPINDRDSVINPDSAIRGLQIMSNRATRMFSSGRLSRRSRKSIMSFNTDYSRSSTASSIDPFQYDTVKSLDTIGEDDQPVFVSSIAEHPSSHWKYDSILATGADTKSDRESTRDTITVDDAMREALRDTLRDTISESPNEESIDVQGDSEDDESMRYSSATSMSLDLETEFEALEAILSRGADRPDYNLVHHLTDIGIDHTSLYAPSEWDTDDAPSTAGLPEAEAILAKSRIGDTVKSQTSVRSVGSTGSVGMPFGETITVGLDRGVLFDVSDQEDPLRRTQYIQAGRNSEYDGDILFCLKPSELKSPTVPKMPPLPKSYM